MHAPRRKSMRRKVFFSRSTRNTDTYLNLIGKGAPVYSNRARDTFNGASVTNDCIHVQCVYRIPAEANTYATLYTGCPSFLTPFFPVVQYSTNSSIFFNEDFIVLFPILNIKYIYISLIKYLSRRRLKLI